LIAKTPGKTPVKTPDETPGQPLDNRSRRALLDLARKAAARASRGDPPGDPGPAPPGLDRAAPVFVTLRVSGELQGCIGTCEARASLWEAVHDMAAAAASRDPRFSPLAAGDLERLGVEISVLSPARRVTSPSEIEIGRHGLEVRRGPRRGLLLPQVATDHHLDRESFLGETCRKAGLPAHAWRDPETEIHVFEAEVFGDGE
jgi:AmmeMemoRadiSam system protein A